MNRVFARHTVNLDLSAYFKYLSLLKDGRVTEGEGVYAFEKAFGEFIGAAACLGVSSARAGFFATLKSLEIGAGDEVVMPAYTFPSMPAVVAATGAKPVFVDVDPETFNLDPALARAAITPRTRAIVVAHLFGLAADMEALSQLAAEKGIYLLEDCAHAAGVKAGGKRVGSLGDAGFFSFGIGKNMPCFGGGAVTFADREIAGKVRKFLGAATPETLSMHLKVLGSVPSYVLTRPWVFPWTLYVGARVLSSLGSDAMDRSVEEPLSETTKFSLSSLGTMTNLQAAVGISQLEKLPSRNTTLAANGRRLAERLADVPTIKAPPVVEAERHVYLYFRILVPERETFRALLLKRGVDTQRDDMANCAGLEAFKAFAAHCPVAEGLPGRSIEIPNNVHLSGSDVDYIAGAVTEVAAEVSAGAAGGHA
ncbi:MAG: DegT/DnrJ/EryC1/StrS family aminotransferase [Planctomycetota bacterium]|jgi:dTDP-4-amino-4,6-dideoxygalactose transaminase